MNEVNLPGYYAIIPSSVRYCSSLKFAERLLYGEITALLNKEGYCFATNRYFSDLFGVIPGTVSRWISHLEKLGFIKIELIRNDKKEIIQRRIFITDISCRKIVNDTYEQKKQYPYEQNNKYPISKKDKGININIRIDRFFNFILENNLSEIYKEFSSNEKYKQFCIIIERLEMNYTKDMISIFNEDNIEKIKVITYCIKEIINGNKNSLSLKLDRNKLLDLYEKCKKIESENKDTDKEIKSFYDYYYISVIKELEKN